MKISKVIGELFRVVFVGLAGLWLTACVAPQAMGPVGLRPANDRLLLAGEIHVAEAHLRDFGYDPGPVDGIYTAQTQAAVRRMVENFGCLSLIEIAQVGCILD
jgi:hypothetical protein